MTAGFKSESPAGFVGIRSVLGAIAAGEAPRPDVHCFGLTAGGAPIHPMARGRSRVPLGMPLVEWRAARNAAELPGP